MDKQRQRAHSSMQSVKWKVCYGFFYSFLIPSFSFIHLLHSFPIDCAHDRVKTCNLIKITNNQKINRISLLSCFFKRARFANWLNIRFPLINKKALSTFSARGYPLSTNDRRLAVDKACNELKLMLFTGAKLTWWLDWCRQQHAS